MSLLKPKKDATTASSTQSPQSPTVSPNTATVASLKMSVSSSGSTESASKKSAALLSLLKPSTATAEVENSSTQAANVAISICTNGTTVGTSSSAMSMQLLSVLKSPSNNGVKSTTATTAIAIAASDTAGAAPGTGPGASISLASFPSTSTTKAAPVPTSAKFSSKHTNGSSGGNQKASDSEPNSQQQKQILEDQQRAELMLKLIKPRTTTVDDLLTDVDIAARVKAASVKVATADNSALLTNNCNALHSSKLATTTVTPTVPVAVTVTAVGDGIGNALPAPTSKEDMLKNILMGKKKPVVTSAVSVSAPVSAPPAQPTTTSIPAAISALNSKNSVAGNNAISVQLATPSAYKPASSVSPTTVVAATAASATPAVVTDTQKHITATAGEIGKQSISTQRSAELLAAALRNTANSIRVAQQMGTTQRSPLTSSPVLTSLYGPPIPNLGPSPAPSPASSGLPAPVAWASLSNGNLPVAAGTSALGGKAGANVTASAPAPARPVPVLISPSDLRNITATTTASR